jgi:hypothetical protein
VLATPDGMPVAWCLANPQHGERAAAEELLDRAARQHVLRPGLVILADKGLPGTSSRGWSASWTRCWPAPTAPMSRPGSAAWAGCGSGSRRSLTPSKISSGWSVMVRTRSRGCGSRVAQRLLALAAGVWFDWQLNAPVKRCLVAYDR